MERELETTCWPALDAGWALEEASRSGEEGEVARRLLSDWFAFAAAGGDEAALPPGYGGETLRDLAQASEKLAELQRVAAGSRRRPSFRWRKRDEGSMRRAAEAPSRGARAPRPRRLGRRARGPRRRALRRAGAGAKDRGDAETGADRLRTRCGRGATCSAALGRRGELGVAVDALCGPDLADAAVLVDGVAARLCDDGALGLRARVFAVLAAADYDDVEDREGGGRATSRATCSRASRRAATSTPSRRRRATSPRCWGASSASSSPPRRRRATRTTRTGPTRTTTTARRRPGRATSAPCPGAAELRCRVDDLLDSISTACDRREADWLGGSLRPPRPRGVVDDACHDLGVERLRDYDALLAGPLRGAVVAEASEKLRAADRRDPPRRGGPGSVPRGVVEAVLRGEDAPRARAPPRTPARRRGPSPTASSTRAAAPARARAILAESAPPSKASRGFRFGRGPGRAGRRAARRAAGEVLDVVRGGRRRCELARETAAGGRRTSPRSASAGAFVLGRDVDELRRAVSDLGSDRADAHFAALREGVAVFKLDPESLKYLVLQPDGPLAGLDRAAVVDVLSRRTDAWTYRGRRAAWVDELAASF
ncbi:hypothetical protein JL720_7023 [Aureococcus anophagefferens]|nr:hypothetical protein JL720_7023 [Aureococcus anophagefferens]